MYTIEMAERDGWEERASAFVAWKARMDREVIRRIGMSTYDLPDWAFADHFEDEIDAEDAAELFIEAMMGDLGLDPNDLQFED